MISPRKFLPHPWLSFFMVVVWLLITNGVSVGNLVMGVFLGWLIPLFTDVFWPDPPVLRRPLVLMKFGLRVLLDILTANLDVARLILGPSARLRPAFVEYPLELEHEFAISLLASTISLTPGTVSSDISDDRKILLIHGLDIADPQVLIDTIKQRYEKPLMEVFECSRP
ncbi:MAG TPA: Na+/H+ antiporter subunit E [Pseudomonas xinjiangensis]|uniref:Na+/H+ antiporter subunit E n=2 Tax=root TaxID=1 RepID=A0A7V1FRV1_9GAMM|nr:Na+/H+ antiporter subunit E [Halopseudomonas xinjiangensis]HEC46289.1 Na+/H+ antiporter subunit E [Halopseudomonas xinjiangensis]